MTQAIVNNINTVFKYREKILNFLVFGILICLILYIYLLHSAISNVVYREKISKDNRILSTDISVLESKYFLVKNSIDMDLAYAKGFRDSEVNAFISKNPITAMVNKNGL